MRTRKFVSEIYWPLLASHGLTGLPTVLHTGINTPFSSSTFNGLQLELRHFDTFRIDIKHSIFEEELSMHIVFPVSFTSYGNRGRRVFKRGIQNWKDFCLKINMLNGNYWIFRVGVSNGEVQKFDFQSQFSMSKIIRIFLIFFIEEYQFRSTFFVIDIFW